MTTPQTLMVPRRFNGPTSSGNGGYSAGVLAEHLARPSDDGWPVTTIQLRQPPPLDSHLQVVEGDAWTEAAYGERVVLRGRLGDAEPEPVPAVDLAVARAAEESFPGLTQHPFPDCFVCGPAREPGDGLRLFAGEVEPLGGAVRVATTWTPTEASLPFVWAALDCPGAWSLDFSERRIVLGQMSARVHRLPEVGHPHVVMGLAGAHEGRKHFSRTSLYDEHGAVLATTEQVWIAIDPQDFQ